MSVLASLNLPANGGIMDLKGDYSFSQTDPARVNFGNWSLKMSAGKHFLEVGGQDLGPAAVASAVTSNCPGWYWPGRGPTSAWWTTLTTATGPPGGKPFTWGHWILHDLERAPRNDAGS